MSASAPLPSPPEGPRHTPAGTADAMLRRLEWSVIRRLDGLLHGDYRTLFRGSGLDLADLREYQYHDDVRHIDWNVTARLQIPHVREFHEERELSAWFLLDLSPSIDFGSETLLKRQVAVEFVAVLAQLLSRRGNRVGALMYGEGLDTVISPKSGRKQVLQLLHRMQARPVAKELGTATDLGVFLREAAPIMPRRSLVFVVSDFISAPGWDKPLAHLTQRHDVVAVRLFDPLEMNLPDLGLLLMQDAETGEQIFVDTHDKGFRKRFAAAADLRETQLREAFSHAGVDVLELATDDDLVEAMMRFVDLRKQRMRARNGFSHGLPPHLGQM